MKQWRCKTAYIGLGVCVLTLLGYAAAPAALTVTPESIVFNDQERPVRIQILDAGEALPGSAVRGANLYVEGHRYNHMIRIEREADALMVHPTEFLEVGSYDLILETTAGTARVPVRSPLQDLATSLENRAAAQGVTVEALREAYGLSRPLGRELVELGLPESYYVGQTLTLELEGNPERYVTWRVNGEVVAEGLGAYHLRYLFREPGDYIVTMQETRNGSLISTSASQTRVVPEALVEREAPVDTPVRFTAPDGYDQYTWRLADQVLSEEQVLTHTFVYPGEYSLTCVATREGENPGLRQLTYRITVPRP